MFYFLLDNGVELPASILIGLDMQRNYGLLTSEEADNLVKPFTTDKIERAIKDMDPASAPGPDGLPVGFYRELWPQIKDTMLEMFNKYSFGGVEVKSAQLRFDITYPKKIKEANTIKQNRPICLLNVDCKIFTKVLTMMLTPYAEKLISANQIVFIPNRFILDGVVMLHEVLHTLRVSKKCGVILKLDFEKAYDKVN